MKFIIPMLALAVVLLTGCKTTDWDFSGNPNAYANPASMYLQESDQQHQRYLDKRKSDALNQRLDNIEANQRKLLYGY